MLEAQGLVGLGAYELSDAARMLGIKRQDARRWLGGYDYRHAGQSRRADPLWPMQLPQLDGRIGLTFLDLVQLRIVRDLLAARFSLQLIRRAINRARELLGADHPFATGRFRTDGRRIFLEVLDEHDEPQIIDLLNGQYGFHRVIQPSFKDLDLENDIATRWWPMTHRRLVVLDPERAFGQPITSVSGVATETLANAAIAQGSAALAARWYQVSTREVRDAIAFERINKEVRLAA